MRHTCTAATIPGGAGGREAGAHLDGVGLGREDGTQPAEGGVDALAGHELQHKVGVPRAAQAVAQPEVRIKGLPHATSTNQQRDNGGDNSGEQVFPRIGACGVWRMSLVGGLVGWSGVGG